MCLQHQNALWQRNAQRVHHNHAALGITLQKLLPGGVDILNGAGQLAGKRHEQDIPARGEHGLEVFLVGGGRQQGCDRRGTLAHGVEELLFPAVAAQIVKVFLAVHHIGHVDHVQLQLVYKPKRQIGVRIREECV